MGSGVTAEQDEMPTAGQGAFGCWTEVASPNVAISAVGSILATRIGGMLGGIFRMLDSPPEILQGRLDALDRKPDESLGKLAAQNGFRFAKRRLLRIKGHPRGGAGSNGQPKSAGRLGRPQQSRP